MLLSKAKRFWVGVTVALTILLATVMPATAGAVTVPAEAPSAISGHIFDPENRLGSNTSALEARLDSMSGRGVDIYVAIIDSYESLGGPEWNAQALGQSGARSNSYMISVATDMNSYCTSANAGAQLSPAQVQQIGANPDVLMALNQQDFYTAADKFAVGIGEALGVDTSTSTLGSLSWLSWIIIALVVLVLIGAFVWYLTIRKQKQITDSAGKGSKKAKKSRKSARRRSKEDEEDTDEDEDYWEDEDSQEAAEDEESDEYYAEDEDEGYDLGVAALAEDDDSPEEYDYDYYEEEPEDQYDDESGYGLGVHALAEDESAQEDEYEDYYEGEYDGEPEAAAAEESDLVESEGGESDVPYADAQYAADSSEEYDEEGQYQENQPDEYDAYPLDEVSAAEETANLPLVEEEPADENRLEEDQVEETASALMPVAAEYADDSVAQEQLDEDDYYDDGLDYVDVDYGYEEPSDEAALGEDADRPLTRKEKRELRRQEKQRKREEKAAAKAQKKAQKKAAKEAAKGVGQADEPDYYDQDYADQDYQGQEYEDQGYEDQGGYDYAEGTYDEAGSYEDAGSYDEMGVYDDEDAYDPFPQGESDYAEGGYEEAGYDQYSEESGEAAPGEYYDDDSVAEAQEPAEPASAPAESADDLDWLAEDWGLDESAPSEEYVVSEQPDQSTGDAGAEEDLYNVYDDEADLAQVQAELTPQEQLQAQQAQRMQLAQESLRSETAANTQEDLQAMAAAQAAAAAAAEAEARAKAEAEARAKAEEEARIKAEEEARLKAEAEARAKAEAEARAKAEAQARAKAEEEARIQAQIEEQMRIEAEARAKAEAEARAKAEEEARLKAEAEARAKAEAEARAKAEAEAKAKAEEEARIKAEEEARAKAQAEARAKAEEEARIRAEVEARVRQQVEAELAAKGITPNAPAAPTAPVTAMPTVAAATPTAAASAPVTPSQAAPAPGATSATTPPAAPARPTQPVAATISLRSLDNVPSEFLEALRDTDDLVRNAHEDLNLAQKQLGRAETRPFMESLAKAENQVRRSFAYVTQMSAQNKPIDVNLIARKLQEPSLDLHNKASSFSNLRHSPAYMRDLIPELDDMFKQAERTLGQAEGVLKRLSYSLTPVQLRELEDDIQNANRSLEVAHKEMTQARSHAAIGQNTEAAHSTRIVERNLLDAMAAARRLGDFDAYVRAEQKRAQAPQGNSAEELNARLEATMEAVVCYMTTVDDFVNVRRNRIGVSTRVLLGTANSILTQAETYYDTDPKKALGYVLQAERVAKQAQEEASADAS